MNQQHVIKKAWWLSIAGVLPFICLTIEQLAGVHLLQDIFHQPPLVLFLFYAAIILSFLGGITWGIALQLHGNSSLAGWILSYSVVPALVGWGALATLADAMPTHMTWLLLMGGFATQLKIESDLHKLHIMPLWFWQLRTRISGVVIFTLLLNWITY